MQMKTIVSVCQLSIYSPVMIWYLGRRGEGDTVSPNTNLNIAQNLMTNFTRHETPDLCDLASITRPRSLHNESSPIQFRGWGQVSREAGSSKPVEIGKYFLTRPMILLTQLGITTTCREPSTLRDVFTAKAKGVLGAESIFGPSTMQRLFYTMDGTASRADRFSKWRWKKSWVVISRVVDRYVT